MTNLPVITIQCDWNEVVKIPNAEAWISSKKINENSVHDKLKTMVNQADGKIRISFTDNFQYLSHSVLSLVVRHISSGMKVIFVAPTKVHKVHKKAILSVSVAENALVVSSCEEDKLLVWDSRTSESLLDLKGHGGPIYKCRFFPSGIVVLSAGADGSGRIWSAETGINPVTLKGHTLAWMDACIIEKGRNVISVSKDGTAKLWDVGESNVIDNIIEGHGVINCCSVAVTNDEVAVTNEREALFSRSTYTIHYITRDPGPWTLLIKGHSTRRYYGAYTRADGGAYIGTSNKLLVAGCEDGSIICAHIAKRQTLFCNQLGSPCNACIIVDEFAIVGCGDGKIVQIHLYGGVKIKEWHESASPIISMTSLPNQMFVVGRQDGTCTVLSMRQTHSMTRLQLTGSDCDGIRDISFNGKWIFTGSRDSSIRQYDFNQVLIHFK